MKPELPSTKPAGIASVYLLTRMVNKDVVSLMGHRILEVCKKMGFDSESKESNAVWKNRFIITALYPDNTFDIQTEDGCAIISGVDHEYLFGFAFYYKESKF